MSLLKRLVATPLLSTALFGLWLVLARSTSVGHLVLGLALGLAIPLVTARYQPTPLRARKPLVIARFILTVGRDVLMSNLEVAWGVVRWPWRKPDARFVIIALDLRDPVGLAALSMVATVVPGTVWSELALDRSVLLLHIWDVGNEAEFIARFKARYEQPLQEIFE